MEGTQTQSLFTFNIVKQFALCTNLAKIAERVKRHLCKAKVNIVFYTCWGNRNENIPDIGDTASESKGRSDIARPLHIIPPTSLQECKKWNIQFLKAVVSSVILTILVSNKCDMSGQLQESRPILSAFTESTFWAKFLNQHLMILRANYRLCWVFFFAFYKRYIYMS